MSKFVTRFFKDESGATAIEYGLIAALIAAVLITVLTNLGSGLNDKFQSIQTSVAGAGAS
jgi:pilus assembly protein Flp/PilA